MITTDRFAFVHLHKSGGSFISDALLRFVPSAQRIGYHYPQRMLPAAARGLPVLGTVRNPWDFYVSYYHFQQGILDERNARNAKMSPAEMEAFIAAGNDPLNGMDTLFLELSDNGRLGFQETTRRLLLLDQDPEFERVLDQMPTQLNRRGADTPVQVEGFRGMNVLRDDLAAARGAGLGLMSFLFRHMYGEAPTAHFLKVEGLRQELLDWLPTVGVGPDDVLQRFILQGERVNTSQRDDRYLAYYDAELAQLVRERDRGIVERFGYTFDEDERI